MLGTLPYSLASLLLLFALVLGNEDVEDLFAEIDDPHESDNANLDTTTDDQPSKATSKPKKKKDGKVRSAPPEQEDPEDAFVWPTTEEEMRADFLADEHHCNGCKGVAFQINQALQALMPMDGQKRKLGEHEYMEAMECRTKIYDDYGLKKLPDKTRVLTGPGLEYDDYQGSKFGGARWPERMARFCGTLVGDLGEDEVYRLWTDYSQDEGYADFAAVLCDPYCGGPPRVKIEKPSEDEEIEKPKKKKRQQKPPREEDVSGGPMQVVQVEDKKQLLKMVNKKRKFVFLMFCAPSFARCLDLMNQWEKAARAAKKDKTFKDIRFAMADSDKVGTFDYELDRGILPAFLFFRPGYAAPKGVKADDMLKLRESGDFLNFVGQELDNYMKDDPANFPRGKLEL